MLSNEALREAIESFAGAARVLRSGINDAQTLVGILSECLDELNAEVSSGDEGGVEFDDDPLAAMTRQRDTLMGKLLHEGAEHEKTVRELRQQLRAETQRRDDARALALSTASRERAIALAKLWGLELNEGTHDRAHQVWQRIAAVRAMKGGE